MILKIGEIAFDETVEYNEEWTEMFPARYDRERRLDGARLPAKEIQKQDS